MLNITDHQENATQNRNETTSHSWDGYYQTNRKQVLVKVWRHWDLCALLGGR